MRAAKPKVKKIQRTNRFKKDLKGLIRKNPTLKNKFEKAFTNFLADKWTKSLNVHSLKGKFKGYSSFNLTGDLRVIYRLEKQTLILLMIDSHDHLYGH